jgi:hypothetical protein
MAPLAQLNRVYELYLSNMDTLGMAHFARRAAAPGVDPSGLVRQPAKRLPTRRPGSVRRSLSAVPRFRPGGGVRCSTTRLRLRRCLVDLHRHRPRRWLARPAVVAGSLYVIAQHIPKCEGYHFFLCFSIKTQHLRTFPSSPLRLLSVLAFTIGTVFGLVVFIQFFAKFVQLVLYLGSYGPRRWWWGLSVPSL